MTKVVIENRKILVEKVFNGYVSGFFDAEGTVKLDDNKAEPEVSIKQTHLLVLELINRRFDGGIERLKIQEGHKQAYRWRSSKGATKIRFLEYIYPNLVEKRKQVELSLQYLKEVKTDRIYFRLPKSQREHREWLKQELSRLKHEKYDERELKNYDNELKKLKIPKDIREGKQATLVSLEDWYKDLGIYDNEDIEDNSRFTPNILSNTFIGYLAGFFDGEGYVGIEKGKRDSYQLFVIITNSNFDILKLYQDRFGGDIRPSNDKNAKEYHKPKWKWYVTNNRTLPILKEIYKWTVVKKPQIYDAIKFQEWHNKIGAINTVEKKKLASRYMLKIKELKKDTGE